LAVARNIERGWIYGGAAAQPVLALTTKAWR
jgi:hypothetical protein